MFDSMFKHMFFSTCLHYCILDGAFWNTWLSEGVCDLLRCPEVFWITGQSLFIANATPVWSHMDTREIGSWWLYCQPRSNLDANQSHEMSTYLGNAAGLHGRFASANSANSIRYFCVTPVWSCRHRFLCKCALLAPLKDVQLATANHLRIMVARTCPLFTCGATNKCVSGTADEGLILKMTLRKMGGKGQDGGEPGGKAGKLI